MSELIDRTQLENLEHLLKQWDDACRASLEHGTPQNNHTADVLAGTLAGYVRPLFDTLQEISRRSDVLRLFEGCDELNEDTHEENERMLLGALDTISEIARGVFDEDGGAVEGFGQ